jgi:signal transduction histidine kinase
MMELLELYLDVARLDADAMKVRLEPVALLGVVEDAVAEQSSLASEAGVTIELDVPRELAATADAELLGRVAENLLNNAIKYNFRGGKVRVSASEDERGAALSFKDTGRGIAESELPRVFDRYYQAQARRAGRIKGNGLGLTFCKEALRLMGGTISAASEPGKGTEFVVRLAAAGGQP